MGTLLIKKTNRRNSNYLNTNKLLLTIFMLILSIVMIIPFIMMISASFKHSADAFTNPLEVIPKNIFLGNYEALFKHPYYFKWFLNTSFVVVLTIALKVIIISMAAYAFARLRFKGRELLFLVLMSAMMVSPDTTIVPRYLLYRYMGLTDSLWVLIIPSLFGVYFVFLLRQFFMGIPMELSEAALIDGCNHFKIYRSVVLPLALPAILTMTLFVFIWSWNDYVNPFIFITPIQKQVITVGLQSFRNEYTVDTAMQMAGICVAVLPIIIIFTLIQKHFVEGIASTGIKG